MAESYSSDPAPIGWVERLDKRFMDHLEAEKEQWHKLHEELAILRTKMEIAEKDRQETKEALNRLVKDMSEIKGAYSEIKGAYQQNRNLLNFAAVIAAVASAIAAWLGMKS